MKYLPEKNEISIDNINKNHKELIRKNKSILKTQQRFKSERHFAFTEEITKIALSSSDEKNQLINQLLR